MNIFPAAAATTPATSTVDHRAKIPKGLYPAFLSIEALAAASGIPPTNMPTMRVRDKLSNSDELRTYHETSRNRIQNVSENDCHSRSLTGLGQGLFRLAPAQMLQIAGRHPGPLRRISVAGTQISDRPLVAEPPHRGCQLMVVRNEAIKIFLADFQQVPFGRLIEWWQYAAPR